MSETKIIPLSDTAKSLIDDINKEAPITKSVQDLADESIIPQGVEIPKPDLVFAMDGIPLFTKKSLSTLIGKAKSGKTTITAWVVAQTITLDMSVLWIDTEQGAYYGSRTQFWILAIAKMLTSKNLIYSEIKQHNPKVRAQITKELIVRLKPDLVIVDGVRDFVFDINSPEEATMLTGDLMNWADVYDCHILSIIHQNKGNEHARGHLGSEMINKSETVIKVSQDEKKLTICEPEFTRGKPFEIFAFDRDEHGIPFVVDYKAKLTSGESNNKKLTPVDVPKETHNDCLIEAFGVESELSYSDLQHAVCAAFEMYGTAMGINKSKNFIAFYIQNGYLLKADKKSNKTFYVRVEQKIVKKKDHFNTDKGDEAPF